MQQLFVLIALISFSLATALTHHGHRHPHGGAHHHRSRRSDPLPSTGGDHIPSGTGDHGKHEAAHHLKSAHGNHSESHGKHLFKSGHANHTESHGAHRFPPGHQDHAKLAGQHGFPAGHGNHSGPAVGDHHRVPRSFPLTPPPVDHDVSEPHKVVGDHPSFYKFINDMKREEHNSTVTWNQVLTGTQTPNKRKKYGKIDERIKNMVK
ncbi:unnamed protein product [Rotaria socialis]|uniref:Uncharacterized protein n=2 Tax=Rotaria socialis TaxID=392032 RepID=A0A818IEG8_9BILA|nr:unnamed protein product [Rotaria socialis]